MISIVIPVFNEEAVITETIDKIQTVLSSQKIDYEIITVNDGSSDSTESLLKERNDIILISRKDNKGYGFSLKEGIIGCHIFEFIPQPWITTKGVPAPWH